MKTLKIFLTLFLLLLFRGFSQSQGQKKIDSLLVLYEQTQAIDNKADLLTNIFNIQLYSEPSRAKEIIEELLIISKKENYVKGVVMANYSKGSYHFIVQEYDSAMHYYKKTAILSRENNLSENLVDALSGMAAVKGDQGDYYGAIQLNDSLLPLYKAANNFLSYGVALGNIARLYSNIGQYDRAMQGYVNALSVLDTISEEPFRKADVLRDIGRLNHVQKSYVSAIDYLNKALRIYQETDDNLYQSYTLNDMGNTFAAMNQIEEAVTHYQRSLAISEKFSYDNNTANVLANLGSSYRDLGKYDIALKSLLKALEISRSGNSIDNVVSQLAEIGKTYVDRNEISKALSYLNEAIALADSIETKNYQLSAIGYRAEAYSKKKDYQRAFEDQKSYQSLNDSLFNADKTKEIEQLKTVYETEKKEAAIALQEEEIKTLNQEVEISNLRKGLYAGGMASALALFGLSVFGYRQRIKKNRIAREKQEEIYKQEIAHKKKELTSQTLHLVQKNTFIQELKENLESLKNSPEKFKVEFRRIVMLLKKQNASDKDWEVFKSYFSEVHNDFDQKLKTLYPDISEKEIRLAAFLRMNLTTKEIAATLNVLPDSILKSKYRLKKKLSLGKETDLTGFLNTL